MSIVSPQEGHLFPYGVEHLLYPRTNRDVGNHFTLPYYAPRQFRPDRDFFLRWEWNNGASAFCFPGSGMASRIVEPRGKIKKELLNVCRFFAHNRERTGEHRSVASIENTAVREDNGATVILRANQAADSLA